MAILLEEWMFQRLRQHCHQFRTWEKKQCFVPLKIGVMLPLAGSHSNSRDGALTVSFR